MAAIVVRFFLLLSLLFIQSPAEKYPTDAKFVRTCTNEHNRHRSAVNPGASNMYLMSWDAGLAKTARAWSKTCNFRNNPHLQTKGKGHPVYETVGENIYAVSGSFSVRDAIQAWYNEGTHFDFEANKCNKSNCKHYTQLVWGQTYKLGCAANHCPNGIKSSEIKDGTVFVCNYSPCGNRKGEAPYFKGPPCTGCGDDFCRSRLCSDPDREAIDRMFLILIPVAYFSC
ncbi:glioma pathogenesis-related protein 1-like [Carcharodon carcharias]|uniref:glioma pathogenesis-related protein 1-like n=1 Tax=Carcharodon carcharias TaxID=13397 RepID=UPI001B7F72BD|nr:glioma pathogenesis-related protein 1-like [Carcharodon carcharias]